MILQLFQILIAALGGFAFDALGMPAAWVTGPVMAIVLWNLTGRSRAMPPQLVDAAMVLSGVTMGSAVTPEMVAAIALYPVSLLVLAVAIVAMTLASAFFLIKVAGWRRDEAVLASTPGALSTVLLITAERNANVAKVGIAQSLRLFLLVMALPSMIVLGGGGMSVPVALRPPMTPFVLLGVMIATILFGLLLERIGLAAAMLLAGTLVSAIAHGTGLIHGTVPASIATFGFIMVGLFVGLRFRIVEGHMLRNVVPAALGSFLIAIIVAGLFAMLAAILADVGFADALIAFSPGALEVMTILGLLLGLDPVYITLHHLARFIGLGILVPFVFAKWKR